MASITSEPWKLTSNQEGVSWALSPRIFPRECDTHSLDLGQQLVHESAGGPRPGQVERFQDFHDLPCRVTGFHLGSPE